MLTLVITFCAFFLHVLFSFISLTFVPLRWWNFVNPSSSFKNCICAAYKRWLCLVFKTQVSFPYLSVTFYVMLCIISLIWVVICSLKFIIMSLIILYVHSLQSLYLFKFWNFVPYCHCYELNKQVCCLVGLVINAIIQSYSVMWICMASCIH